VGGVAAGVGVVGAGVADVDGPDGAAGGGSGSHDSPPDVVAALAAVLLAVRARLTPENPVSRTLPAISVTVAGRACPKRMKTPYPVQFRRGMSLFGHQASGDASRSPTPS
jgi:hypothetical protein